MTIPLVDCHSHVGGSISPQFVWRAIQQQELYYLAESYNDVVQAMTFAQDEPHTFHRFLDKFRLLDRIHWTEELVEESIQDVCLSLVSNNVDYVWMRLSINKYLDHINWHRREAIKFIHDAFEKYAPGRVGLILSLKYESERAGQRKCTDLITHPDVYQSVVGIDLVGDEEFFDHKFYIPIYKAWKSAGKRLFAHVGESQTAKNVLSAICDLGVTDICHGIRSLSEGDELSRAIIENAIDNDVCFHMALSSNLLTGVVVGKHPITEFLFRGLNVTIGTDDPVVCNTNIHNEYDLARRYLSLADIGDVDGWIITLRQNAYNRVRGEYNLS